MSTSYKCVNLNPTGCMDVQPAEPNMLLGCLKGALGAPVEPDGKISTQLAESNRLQHTGCCNLLGSAGYIPMQPVGFRLTHLYYVDRLI